MYTPDFTHAMELYKTNYVNYLTAKDETLKSAYKIAYTNAENWIQAYLNQTQKNIATKSQDIDKFVQEYSTANPDMVKLKSEFKQIRTQGPKLEDQYIQIKRVNEEPIPKPDPYSYYMKGGIVLGLLGIIGVVSMF